MSDSAAKEKEVEDTAPTPTDITSAEATDNVKKIELNAEFDSFLELRDSIEKYQKENSVQLIVKDSKLLRAESTRKIIPKVYHLVNKDLMYHSITYCCKCHGELKQKRGTRIRNVGQKRLNCPMYIRFKLSPDLKKLVVFDLDEAHNHGIDPTTCQMTPRQQVYRLSRMKRGRPSPSPSPEREDEESENSNEYNAMIESAFKDAMSDCDEPTKKAACHKSTPTKQADNKDKKADNAENDEDDADEDDSEAEEQLHRAESPLDPNSSCSDSDEEEIRKNRALLPFPIRLIGSAIQSNPELIALTKQLIDTQKSKLNLEKQKLLLETKNLELANSKLELELRTMEKNLAAEMDSSQGREATIYLQTT